MATFEPPFEQTPHIEETTIVTAGGTAAVPVFTASSTSPSGSRIRSINVATSDTADNNYDVILNDGSTDYVLGNKAVLLGAGYTAGKSAVELLDPAVIPGLESDGTLWLPPNYVVKVAPKVAVTAGQTDIVATGADY